MRWPIPPLGGIGRARPGQDAEDDAHCDPDVTRYALTELAEMVSLAERLTDAIHTGSATTGTEPLISRYS